MLNYKSSKSGNGCDSGQDDSDQLTLSHLQTVASSQTVMRS